jgi:hypothetical protein
VGCAGRRVPGFPRRKLEQPSGSRTPRTRGPCGCGEAPRSVCTRPSASTQQPGAAPHPCPPPPRSLAAPRDPGPPRHLRSAASRATARGSDAEVRHAYKRQALLSHPDKNPGQPDAAGRFRAVRHAFEVLSDPRERAWYDANRVRIVGARACAWEEVDSPREPGDHLWALFAPDAFRGFGDGPGGFYQAPRPPKRPSPHRRDPCTRSSGASAVPAPRRCLARRSTRFAPRSPRGTAARCCQGSGPRARRGAKRSTSTRGGAPLRPRARCLRAGSTRGLRRTAGSAAASTRPTASSPRRPAAPSPRRPRPEPAPRPPWAPPPSPAARLKTAQSPFGL